MSTRETPDLVPLTVNGRVPSRISRRQAMQWVLGAVAASALPVPAGLAQPATPPDMRQKQAAAHDAWVAGGYGTDPNLMKVYKPGDLWPLTFTPAQHRAAAALADVILPADHFGPAASTLGVVEMVDEWISAPYPHQQHDRATVTGGLDWLDRESKKRFGKEFASLADAQKHALCDDICYPPAARPEFRKAAGFFSVFRSLCAGAYYSTPAGWQAIGYVGNTALPSFEGPPPEVLKILGVTQTVA